MEVILGTSEDQANPSSNTTLSQNWKDSRPTYNKGYNNNGSRLALRVNKIYTEEQPEQPHWDEYENYDNHAAETYYEGDYQSVWK